MYRLRKKMATLLIALFMISTIAFVSASPGITLTTDGEGTARIVNEEVELWIPTYDEDRLYDEARVVFDYDGDLNSIEGVSFQSYVTGYGGLLHPCVILAVDIDAVEGVDAWVCQFIWSGGPNDPSEDEWREISFDDSSLVHVAGATTGLPAGHFKPYTNEYTETDTLESLKASWGEHDVVEVKVMIGMFVGTTEPILALVDDVMINTVLYDFNLKSEGPVSLKVNSVEIVEEVRISIDKAIVDFGKIVEGESALQTVTITNEGTIAELIQAELQGEVPTDFFTANLKLDVNIPVADWSIPSLAVNTPTGVDLTLSIPPGTPAGVKTAVLIFWAEAA